MRRPLPMLQRKRTVRRDDSFRAGPNGFMSFDTLGLSDKVVSAVKAVGTHPHPNPEPGDPARAGASRLLGLAQTARQARRASCSDADAPRARTRPRAHAANADPRTDTRTRFASAGQLRPITAANHKHKPRFLIGGVSFDVSGQDHHPRGGCAHCHAAACSSLRARAVLMTGVEILVIDEADRMLDMGFIPDIERIVETAAVHAPDTLLLRPRCRRRSHSSPSAFSDNPVRVEVSKPASTGEHIIQRLVTSGGKPDEKAGRH